MSLIDRLRVYKVQDEVARQRALSVIETVYRGEKGWVSDPDGFFPPEDLGQQRVSWFLAEVDGQPVGITRVLYELPVELYRVYGFQVVDKSLDVEAFLRDHQIAEVGRFAVIPEYRKKIVVSAILMRAAATDTVERGFTHFITDVFETDRNTPLKFHQRVLGFQTVATHSVGELQHLGRRVTLLLELKTAFRRLRARNNWIYRYITQGWNEGVLQELTA